MTIVCLELIAERDETRLVAPVVLDVDHPHGADEPSRARNVALNKRTVPLVILELHGNSIARRAAQLRASRRFVKSGRNRPNTQTRRLTKHRAWSSRWDGQWGRSRKNRWLDRHNRTKRHTSKSRRGKQLRARIARRKVSSASPSVTGSDIAGTGRASRSGSHSVRGSKASDDSSVGCTGSIVAKAERTSRWVTVWMNK